MKGLTGTFTFRLSWLITLTVTETLLLAGGYIVLFGIFLIVWFHAIALLRSLYFRQAQKVAFMFDAIDNSDQAFRFAERGVSSTDRLVNTSLNRIVKILFQAKSDAIQQEKYYELILNSVRTGIISIDDYGSIYQINREAMRLLGIAVFTHVNQVRRIDESLAELLRTASAPGKYSATFSNERGTMNLSIHVSEMMLREQRVRIFAVNDINSELDEKEIDSWIKLIRVLTHEIMNAITPITSLSATLLSLPEFSEEEIRRGLSTINATGKGLIDFVESYRRVTSLPVPHPSLFYVRAFAERIVSLSKQMDNCSNICMEIDVQPDDLILHADEGLISHVMLNLLKNAVQAIDNERTDGLITIRAYANAEEAVIIEVSNNGDRIPEDVASQIFIPFFTTKNNGSGVGLSVSRQIMRISGGNLNLKVSDDTITTFVLTFP